MHVLGWMEKPRSNDTTPPPARRGIIRVPASERNGNLRGGMMGCLTGGDAMDTPMTVYFQWLAVIEAAEKEGREMKARIRDNLCPALRCA